VSSEAEVHQKLKTKPLVFIGEKCLVANADDVMSYYFSDVMLKRPCALYMRCYISNGLSFLNGFKSFLKAQYTFFKS